MVNWVDNRVRSTLHNACQINYHLVNRIHITLCLVLTSISAHIKRGSDTVPSTHVTNKSVLAVTTTTVYPYLRLLGEKTGPRLPFHQYFLAHAHPIRLVEHFSKVPLFWNRKVASNRIRTDDLHITSVAPYQLGHKSWYYLLLWCSN